MRPSEAGAPHEALPHRLSRRPWVPFVALMAWVLLIYARSVRYPFALEFDDGHHIFYNDRIHQASALWKLWFSSKFASATPMNWGYRPVTMFAHALCWRVGGGASWPFQLLKKLLLGVTAFLVFRIWERILAATGDVAGLVLAFPGRSGPWILAWAPASAAFALALWFGGHAALTELADYISATSSLLCGALFAFGIDRYLAFRLKGARADVAWMTIAFLLAVLSKEEAMTFPAALALIEGFGLAGPRGEPTEARRKSVLAAFACALSSAAAGAAVLCVMFAPESWQGRGSVGHLTYLLTQVRALAHYLKLLVWPSGMTADYYDFGFSRSVSDPGVLGAVLFQGLLLGVAWIYRHRFRLGLFGLLWFYLTVSPASSIIPMTEPANDHRYLIPYLGLCGAVFVLALKALSWVSVWLEGGTALPMSGPFLACALAASVAATEVRSRVWSSAITRHDDTVEKNPTSARALNNRILDDMSAGHYPEALGQLEKCRRLWPSYAYCAMNQAMVLVELGREEEGEGAFREALRLGPESAFFYASYLRERGRLHDARRVLGENMGSMTGMDRVRARQLMRDVERELGGTSG